MLAHLKCTLVHAQVRTCTASGTVTQRAKIQAEHYYQKCKTERDAFVNKDEKRAPLRDKLVMRDKFIIGFRNVLAELPKLGLVKKPHFHKEGISFIVPVKDEERWIKPCILSIEPSADEIIVVDSSVEDKTTKNRRGFGRAKRQNQAYKVSTGRQPTLLLFHDT